MSLTSYRAAPPRVTGRARYRPRNVACPPSRGYPKLLNSNPANGRVAAPPIRDYYSCMEYVCDAPGGKTWFRIETEAEALSESQEMNHAVEKYFRREREKAVQSYRPASA